MRRSASHRACWTPPWPGLLALVLALMLGAPGAHSQPLQALLPWVLEHSAEWEAARLETQALEVRARQTEAAQRPTVAATVTGSANQTQNKALVPTHVRARELLVGLQAQHNVINRAEAWGVEVARRQWLQAQEQQESVRRELAWRLTQAYVDVLAARELSRVQSEARRSIERSVSTVSRMLKAGTATVSDLREAQGRLDLAAAQERAALGELRARSAALAQLVGREDVVVRPLAAAEAMDRLDLAPLSEWMQQARQSSSDIAVARRGADIARAEAQRIKASGQMTAALTANVATGYSHNASRTPTDEGPLRSQGSGSQQVLGVGLTVTVPLDASSALSLQYREFLLQVTRQEAQVRVVQQSLDAQVRQAFVSLQSSRDQLVSLSSAEQSSQQALEATERGLRAGLRVLIDVLNAQSQVFAVRRDRVRLQFEALTAWLRLQHLAGPASEPSGTGLP
jgi:outer membrane protein